MVYFKNSENEIYSIRPGFVTFNAFKPDMPSVVLNTTVGSAYLCLESVSNLFEDLLPILLNYY